MSLRFFGIIFIIALCTSCDYFSPETSTADGKLQVLDTVIDYTKVDVYPIFSDCEDFSESDNQKECFEASLREKLGNLLNKNAVKVKDRVNDTALIDLLIDNTGKAHVVEITSPEELRLTFPELDSIIKLSVAELPTMKPARKQAIFVKSQYRLAVVVKTI